MQIRKKELDGLSATQQLNKLKGILEELGMEGRPSLAKCEEIREKLEFEKEMQAIDTSNIITTSRRGQEPQVKISRATTVN